MSSLNTVFVQKPVVQRVEAERSNASPLTTTLFPSWMFVDIVFKDDVTAILLLSVFLHAPNVRP